MLTSRRNPHTFSEQTDNDHNQSKRAATTNPQLRRMRGESALLDQLSATRSVDAAIARSPCSTKDFHEAEILWPEDYSSESHNTCGMASTCNSSFTLPASHNPPRRRQQEQQIPHAAAASAPIAIPAPAGISNSWSFRITCDTGGNYWVEDEDVDIDAEGRHGQPLEIVPPHLFTASRRASGPCHHKMAFSVCTGHGRTLKGRDLSQVRDLVLRLTGFVEPEA